MTSEEQVRRRVVDSVLDSLPVVVFAYDLDGVCTFSDGAGLSAWGLQPGELVGRNILDLYGQRADYVAWLRAALQGQSLVRTYRLGGSTWDLWLTPLPDETGPVTGAIGITMDVSDKARVQEDLDLHRAFVDAAPQFVALAGIDGKVQYVNPGGRRMVGVPDDVDVTTTTIADYLTEEAVRQLQDLEQLPVVEHGFSEVETTLRHWPSGRGIPVRATSFLVRDGITGEPRALATVGTDVTAEKVARAEAARRLSEQRGLLLHLHEAQELERRRIAGEVHDDTIQAVAAVNIRLQALRRSMEAAGHGSAAEALGQMSESVRQATDRLRRLLYDLDMPDQLERDLATALRVHAAKTASPGGPEVEVVSSLTSAPPLHVSRVLFRVAQEALNNARTHAHARRVTIAAAERDHGYMLSVRDDGVGLPRHLATPARGRARAVPGHLGLRSMAERAESVGGWCSARGMDSGGTLVEAWVPARIGYTAAAVDGSGRAGLSTTLLEQTMESISEGYMALDREWRYVYVNELGAAIVRRHDLPGKVCWDEFDFSPEVEDAYRTAMREQRPTSARVLYPDLGRWVESRVFPSADGISVFFRDVTEEVELERRAGARDRILARATELAELLATEPDLERALAGAAALLQETYRLSSVRIAVDGRASVSLGEPAAGDTEASIPLMLWGRRLGDLTIAGPRVSEQQLAGVAAGIALRAGGHREPSLPASRLSWHG